MVVAIDVGHKPTWADSIIYELQGSNEPLTLSEQCKSSTVYTNSNTIPSRIAKKTHPVHTLVLRPLNKLTATTAEKTIVCGTSETAMKSTRMAYCTVLVQLNAITVGTGSGGEICVSDNKKQRDRLKD